MAQTKRVPTRVHTRKIDRAIARQQMKNIGLVQVAKHSHNVGYTISGKRGETTRVDSYFAAHWREYCIGGKKK